MIRSLDYRRKTLEELIKGYPHAEEGNRQMVINEIYGRVQDTIYMLDNHPGDVDQCYRLFLDPEYNFRKTEDGGKEKHGGMKRSGAEIFGVTLKCDAHELKYELEEATERADLLIVKLKELRQLADPLLAETLRNLKL